jgi:electron transfer flavoprotein alpha subunit
VHVFTVAEHRQGTLAPISLELLHLANRVKGADTSNAVLVGSNVMELAPSLALYADKVWVVEDEACGDYSPEHYAEHIVARLRGMERALLLVADTSVGREFAPCIAAKLNAPIQTDVVALDLSDGLSITRSIVNGKVKMDLKLRESSFYVLTVRQKVFNEGPEVRGSIEVVPGHASLVPRRSFVKYVEPEIGEVDIAKEEVLVVVGRGIGGDSSQVEACQELAELLGGVLAGSRPVIDRGLLSMDRQVGITGKVVEPKLYLGLGVSGALQHVMGMSNSQLIVAVNTDPEAPIFEVADYCVVADLREVVPELTKGLRAR